MSKIKVIRQRDAMQCGVASLNMITAFYGSRLEITDLEKICEPSAEGVSLKAIIDAASKIGLNAKAGKVNINNLPDAPLPAILHWKNNHFVVLYKVDSGRNRYYIADPAKGKYVISKDEVIANWSSSSDDGEAKGIICIFEPTPGFISKADSFCSNHRISYSGFLFPYLKEFRIHILKIVLALLLSSILLLILPFLTQGIVDRGIHHKDISIIRLILLGEVMIICGRTAMDFFRSRILLKISTRVNIDMINDFLKRLLKLPISFFESKQSGDMFQRIGDHQRIQQFLTSDLLSVIFSVISFLVFGVVLLIYDKLIFAIFMVGSLMYAGWMMLFLGRRKVLDYEYFEERSKNQNLTQQFLSSIPEIKLQDCGKRRRDEWSDVQTEMMRTNFRILNLQQQQQAGSVIINELKNISITVIAAMAVISGEITLGAMMAIQYIIGQLNSPIESLMSLIYALQDVRISLDRIGEIHVREEESRPQHRKDIPEGSSIEFCNVSFKYNRHALTDTLSNLSAVFESGKVTAIVGASGSGKTTILKLILKYYSPLGGEIRLGNNDFSIYDPDSWRKKCGVVMQEGVIFSESIARNIACDDGEIDEERLYDAARKACIHDYIMTLPWKYNTKIGYDGRGLSKGQKQRILIARAIYRNPEILLLDEATNALDANNEKEIIDNLDEVFKGKTVVIVAHRLSTVKNADKIIVIDNGRIVEQGTHRTLCEKNGYYRKLIGNQLELGE